MRAFGSVSVTRAADDPKKSARMLNEESPGPRQRCSRPVVANVTSLPSKLTDVVGGAGVAAVDV